jgi:Fur family transcriptional regulator, ferric uptake regulator
MDISNALRQSGLKATFPRLRILRLFHERATKHLSAEEIYRFLIDEKIDIGLATVYRVLMQFVETGIVIRRHFESGAAVFELNEGGHHDHLICSACGKVEEFVDRDIERRQEEIAKERGFALREHSLSLYGVCGDCKSTRTATSRESESGGDKHEQQEIRHRQHATF